MMKLRPDTFSWEDDEGFGRESLQFSFQICNKNKMSPAKAVRLSWNQEMSAALPSLARTLPGGKVQQECLWEVQRAWGVEPLNNKNPDFR